MPTTIMYKVRSGMRPDLKASENDGISEKDIVANVEDRDPCFKENSLLTELMLNTWQGDASIRLTFKDCKLKLRSILTIDTSNSISSASPSVNAETSAITSNIDSLTVQSQI